MDEELFELCNKVSSLTGWWSPALQQVSDGSRCSCGHVDSVALYTTDYLLTQLPKTIDDFYDLYLTHDSAEYTDMSETTGHDTRIRADSDSPLKALLKLTLSLHQAGHLKAGGV